ncbi:MAG: hypothetical protein AB7I33_05890 [Gemmatimonadales bacterium]
MTERRYTEEEVAAIFKRAAELQQTARPRLPSGEGTTLTELKEIGREVGIPPELVTEAARSVDPGSPPAIRRFLGLPVGVGRTIELDHPLTDTEWEHLVVDLRETFDARGNVTRQGSFRQWTNGNLQVLVEPTPAGERIRLRTLRGNSRMYMAAGLTMLGGSAAVLLASVLAGLGVAESLGKVAPLFGIGLGLFGMGAVPLPGWARLRRRQMDAIAERVAVRAGALPPGQPAGPGDPGNPG